ncbi:MAG TPA: hypothetical protein VFY45_07845 [Baekduia sp.]|nr:hypothetical protein [Baekduia sp.]
MDRGIPSITRQGRGRAVLLAVGLAAIVGASASPAPAADAQWGFEQVTPVEKGAGTVSGLDTFTAAPDGGSIIHTALGSYDGVPTESVPLYLRYLGVRGPDSWVNHPLDPPYNLGTGSGTAIFDTQGTLGPSPDMSHVLVTSKDALTPGATQGGSNHYIRDGRTGALTLIATTTDQRLTSQAHGLGGETSAKFVANDGRAALFQATVPLTPEAKAASGASTFLYAWRADSGLSVESVLPASQGGGVAVAGDLSVTYDSEDGEVDSAFYDDALSRVYFAFSSGVYLRSGGQTKAISVSRIAGDPATPVGGQINGVADDGRYVVFTTQAGRLTDDSPAGYDKYTYRYDAVTDDLEFINANPFWFYNPVIQVSRDGQTIALRSAAKLDPAATEFSTNVYVWRKGTLRFVATADPGTILDAGALSYLRSLSEDGRYLSFTDDSQARAASFGVDNVSPGCPRLVIGGAGPCAEVYVFDADEPDAAKRLSCASCRTDGQPAVSDAGDPTLLATDRPRPEPGRHRFAAHQQRMVADDGTVFFTTFDGLVPEDGNGLKDVYAYRDGAVRLVSRALPGYSSRFLDASVDGKAIFFSTDDPIAPTDVDKSVDIYVTRVGAGYSYTAPTRVPACGGNDCRGPVAPLGPLVLPSTDTAIGSGNVASKPRVPSPGSPVVAHKTSIRGSAGSLRVRVPVKGRIVISGSGLRSSSVTARSAGSYGIAVRLSAYGRRVLAKRGHVSVRAKVRLVRREGASRTVQAGLTFKAKSNSSKGR